MFYTYRTNLKRITIQPPFLATFIATSCYIFANRYRCSYLFSLFSLFRFLWVRAFEKVDAVLAFFFKPPS